MRRDNIIHSVASLGRIKFRRLDYSSFGYIVERTATLSTMHYVILRIQAVAELGTGEKGGTRMILSKVELVKIAPPFQLVEKKLLIY